MPNRRQHPKATRLKGNRRRRLRRGRAMSAASPQAVEVTTFEKDDFVTPMPAATALPDTSTRALFSFMRKQSKPAQAKIASQLEIEAAFIAVRDSAPECAGFVGVIIERCSPIVPGGANWSVKGVKYGRASRVQCDVAIQTVMKKLQTEFILGTGI